MTVNREVHRRAQPGADEGVPFSFVASVLIEVRRDLTSDVPGELGTRETVGDRWTPKGGCDRIEDLLSKNSECFERARLGRDVVDGISRGVGVSPCLAAFEKVAVRKRHAAK